MCHHAKSNSWVEKLWYITCCKTAFDLDFVADAFFAEMFLGPITNETSWEKYEESNLINLCVNFKPNLLYLIHQPDGLIHLEQMMRFSQSLVNKGVLFKQQVTNRYPTWHPVWSLSFQFYFDNKNYAHVRLHMLRSMENHLNECFGPIEDFFQRWPFSGFTFSWDVDHA